MAKLDYKTEDAVIISNTLPLTNLGVSYTSLQSKVTFICPSAELTWLEFQLEGDCLLTFSCFELSKMLSSFLTPSPSRILGLYTSLQSKVTFICPNAELTWLEFQLEGDHLLTYFELKRIDCNPWVRTQVNTWADKCHSYSGIPIFQDPHIPTDSESQDSRDCILIKFVANILNKNHLLPD